MGRVRVEQWFLAGDLQAEMVIRSSNGFVVQFCVDGCRAVHTTYVCKGETLGHLTHHTIYELSEVSCKVKMYVTIITGLSWAARKFFDAHKYIGAVVGAVAIVRPPLGHPCFKDKSCYEMCGCCDQSVNSL